MADGSTAGPARTRRLDQRARLQRILALVDQHEQRSVRALAETLHVSEVTIRKDLTALEQASRLVRTRGGAVSVSSVHRERTFEVRLRQNRTEKQAIGAVAAALVEDGDVIALDSSTTALLVASAIRERGPWQSLTVVTNGLRAAAELAMTRGVETFVPPGWVRGAALSVITPNAMPRDPSDIEYAKAFLGAAAFTIEGGLMEWTEDEAAIKAMIAIRAQTVIAVLDHTKWGRSAPARFCPTARIGVVVTDAGAPPELMGQLEVSRVDVRLASLPGDG